MTEVQQWLNEKYPSNQREQVEEINNNYGGELTGELTIENFPNLKKVNLAKNRSITKLIIRNCPQVEKIDVQNNQITELFINRLANLEHLNCSNNQLTKLDVELNTKIKELCFSGNPQLRRENIKGLEKLTQLVSFKCDEGLQPIQFLQNQFQQTQQQLSLAKQQLEIKDRIIIGAQNILGVNNLNQLPTISQGQSLQELVDFYNNQQQPREQENNPEDQVRLAQLQQRNQELTAQIQEIQERLASFEILSLEEKTRIQKAYLERLKTNAKSKLDANLHEILDDLLEAQEAISQGENRLVQRLLDRSKQDLLSDNRLTEQEINRLLQARTNLTTLEMQQNQEQQAQILQINL